MSRIVRVIVVLVFLAGVVALGIQGNAWASRLSTGTQSPAAAPADPPAKARQQTVPITPPIIPVTGGQAVTVGSCATVLVEVPVPENVLYTAYVVPEIDLPTPFPPASPPLASLVSCAIKVEAKTYPSLGAKTLVCWPLLPTQAGFAYYYDGSQWLKTVSQTSDGQVCANVVPGTAPNPAFVAVFNK